MLYYYYYYFLLLFPVLFSHRITLLLFAFYLRIYIVYSCVWKIVSVFYWLALGHAWFFFLRLKKKKMIVGCLRMLTRCFGISYFTKLTKRISAPLLQVYFYFKKNNNNNNKLQSLGPLLLLSKIVHFYLKFVCNFFKFIQLHFHLTTLIAYQTFSWIQFNYSSHSKCLGTISLSII